MTLTFSKKLLLISGITSLGFLLVIGVGILTATLVDQELLRIEARYLPLLELGPQLEAELDRLRNGLRDAVSAQDRDQLDATEAVKDDLLAKIQGASELIDPVDAARVRGAVESYYQIAHQLSARLIAGETGEAILEPMAQMQIAGAKAVTELRRATRFDRRQLNQGFQTLRRATLTADWTRFGIAVVSLAIVLGLSFWISSGVLRSVAELSRGFNRFGRGDFELPMAIVSRDELGEAARSANRMAESIRDQQAELRHTNEELRQQTADLDGFSYSVSHDLRAPLRAIDGFSRILIEDHGEMLGEEGKRVAGVIRTNTQKMGQLIDDLLAFSRLGRQPIMRRPADMAGLARLAFEEAARLEPERQIRLVLAELPGAGGDVALLRQVWANLLGNAVKYTRGRAEALIEISASAEGAELIYSIKDNGVGFDMRYADKLFGVFQRLHRAAEFEGTGVGLALVSRIVKRHGGRVWADSKLGLGSTFWFALPREGVKTDGPG